MRSAPATKSCSLDLYDGGARGARNLIQTDLQAWDVFLLREDVDIIPSVLGDISGISLHCSYCNVLLTGCPDLCFWHPRLPTHRHQPIHSLTTSLDFFNTLLLALASLADHHLQKQEAGQEMMIATPGASCHSVLSLSKSSSDSASF